MRLILTYKTLDILTDLGPVDPVRDIETLNEDIESEYVEESESECSEKPLSMSFETHTPISGLNLLDSGSEDYRFNTGLLNYFVSLFLFLRYCFKAHTKMYKNNSLKYYKLFCIS